jgi:hypothetical protein
MPSWCGQGLYIVFTAKYVISSDFPLFDVAFKWSAHISPQI